MGSIVVLKQMVMIFALIILGYFMYKRKFVSEMVMKDLSAIVVNICCPAMILASVFQDMSDISRKNVGIVTGIGLVYYVRLIVFGTAFVKIFRVQTKEKEAYVLMSTFGNVGFIGFPVSLAILGHKSILYVVIFNFLYNIFIFTFGIALVRKGTEGDKKQSWTDIFTPGFVCCIFAFLIYWFQLTVPETLQNIVTYCGNACTFLSMMVIGASVVGLNPKTIIENRKLMLFELLRFLVLPVLIAILLKPILPDYIMRATIILMLALPTGNMPVMLAEQYNKDAHTISEGIILSTVLSVVTITIVFMFV